MTLTCSILANPCHPWLNIWWHRLVSAGILLDHPLIDVFTFELSLRLPAIFPSATYAVEFIFGCMSFIICVFYFLCTHVV